jgi:hypothetical protein
MQALKNPNTKNHLSSQADGQTKYRDLLEKLQAYLRGLRIHVGDPLRRGETL